MPALTLKGIPEETLARLRDMAAAQRRSLNQHAIYLLEQAASAQPSSFARAYSDFLERRKDLPFDGPDEFKIERAPDLGREPVSFE